jgi:hypothetical protein
MFGTGRGPQIGGVLPYLSILRPAIVTLRGFDFWYLRYTSTDWCSQQLQLRQLANNYNCQQLHLQCLVFKEVVVFESKYTIAKKTAFE